MNASGKDIARTALLGLAVGLITPVRLGEQQGVTAFQQGLQQLHQVAVGHFVGRNNPSGAIGLFVATYFVKVVGFAVVLFVIGAPAWLDGRWFLIGAVVTVVFWQAAEIYGFSKARLQIYNDPETRKGGADV